MSNPRPVVRRTGDPTSAERRLLGEFATQAGLAFRNLALTAALQVRAETLARDGEALAASRRRLQDAADAERSRIAAAIRHDVLAHLEPLPAALGELPDDARLQKMEDATSRATAALRVITGGVLPPLLARRGLRAALEAYARQSPDRPMWWSPVSTGSGSPPRWRWPSTPAASRQGGRWARGPSSS